MTSKVERTGTRIQGFPEGELDFQLMRLLGAGNYGGATPGEVFAARSAIQGNDPQEWTGPFVAMATELDALAAEAAPRFPVSARDHALRASMYWRCAEYFADPFGPECPRWGLASRASFEVAARYLEWQVESFSYPFAERQLGGYYLRPNNTQSGSPPPTVLLVTGFDGTAEELYFQAACAGLQRGFQVVITEGPGQMGVMREHPDLPFRPDYEVPIGAMLDQVLKLPGVDTQKLALYGISFGGYFAARAAAHDQRIRAAILNSPIIDLRAYMLGFMGLSAEAAEAQDVSLDELDDIPNEEFPALNKHMFKAACRRFGVRSHLAWLDALKTYRVERLDAISCPVLALAGSGEGGETERQFEAFCKGVSGPVSVWRFANLGSDMHCQLGNLPYSNAVIYNWLSELWP